MAAADHLRSARPGSAARAGAVILGMLVLLLSLTVPAAAVQAASTGQSLIIEDTAGTLYRPQLERDISEISFYEPTTVVIYTYRGSYSDNMNEKVLAYARANHPEWITADGQKWADGLFVFALDPDGRQVGTYFGEDRKVSLDDQSAIQDAAKDDFREANWTEGVVAGVRKAASLVNRPWYASPGFIGTAAVAGVAGLGTWIGITVVRGNRREKFARELARSQRHLTSVTMDFDTTELAARTLPSESSYAQRLEQRFHDFSARYYKAVEEQERLQKLTARERSRSGIPDSAARFADSVAEMDFVDDAIVNAAALLTRSSTWEAAWAAQTAPVLEDVRAISRLIDDSTAAGLASTQALANFQTTATTEIERLGAGLRDASVTPEAALKGLETVRTDLSGLLREHSREMIAAYAEEDSERAAMQEQLESERLSRRPTAGSILDTVSSPGVFWSPISFSAGYSAGVDEVESARSAAVSGSSSFSSSSSTGYGSSGGSFSGSGSSSHF